MARGDTYKLTLSGAALASDSSWVAGALVTSFPVEVVSVTVPVKQHVVAVVRMKSDGAKAPAVGDKVTSAEGLVSLPGVESPSASVVEVQFAGRVTTRVGAIQTWLSSPESAPIKWIGALSLILVTAMLSSQIRQKK